MAKFLGNKKFLPFSFAPLFKEMMVAIDVCDENEMWSTRNQFLGTEIMIVLVSLIIETVVLIYAIYNLFFRSKRGTKTKLQPVFRILVLSYHISLFLFLVLFATDAIRIMLKLSPEYDRSSLFTCIALAEVAQVVLTSAYLSIILFWFLRLKLIFKSSIYQISKTFNIIFTTWIVVSWSICTSLVLIVLIMTLIDLNDNNKNSNIFCNNRIKIIDFIPYMYNDEKYSYSYKLKNFYTCDINMNHQLYQFKRISLIIGAITIPVANLVSFYLYFCKMKANAKNTKNVNSEHQRSRFRHIYVTGIVGVISVGSTLISVILYTFDDAFSCLILIDALLNGVLMIMVLDFGQWMVCECCIRSIDKFIIVKIESQSVPLPVRNSTN